MLPVEPHIVFKEIGTADPGSPLAPTAPDLVATDFVERNNLASYSHPDAADR